VKGSAGEHKGFIAKRLAEELAAETPVATGASGAIHVYRDGAYRPDGEHDLRNRIAHRLGDTWRRNRADETLAFLRATAPPLWPEPPRDRVNCTNGILHLTTGQLAPHDPSFFSPVQIAASFDPEATCPQIDCFLEEVLDAELVPLIHEIAGYLISPDNSLQAAFMFLGSGANGKSTLLSTLTDLLGDENIANVALHRLDEDRFAVAELEGKLANVFADLDARALQASSMFKAITGGDAITGERKYAPAFSFKPYARLLYSANEPPPTPDSSDAFFRRWTIVPFERRFSPSQADRNLLAKLTTSGELSGLLNHALRALPTLRGRGTFLSTTQTTKAAERFRVDSDSVAGFLGECCEVDPQGRVERSRLFNCYRNWCTENNRRPFGKQKFNRHVEDLHPEVDVGPIQGSQHWRGLNLGVQE
jgi:putative DNA primase/helicase